MTHPLLSDTIAQLKKLGDPKVRTLNIRNGAGNNQFGVKLGELRKVAARLKTNHELALALWQSGNLDAQLLATLIIKPAKLSLDDLHRMVRTITSPQAAEWFSSYVVKEHPDKESLRERWMNDPDPWAARAGWALTSGRINRSPDGLDIAALLDRIESEMLTANPVVQWTMNTALYGIGIQFAEHRKRAIAIGEKLGIYRDYPVSKGCVSPFAPIAIAEMVKRKKD